MTFGFGCIWWGGLAQETNLQTLRSMTRVMPPRRNPSIWIVFLGISSPSSQSRQNISYLQLSSHSLHLATPTLRNHSCGKSLMRLEQTPFRASGIVSSWWLHLPLLRLHQPDMSDCHSLKSQWIAKSTFSVSLQTQNGVVQQ